MAAEGQEAASLSAALPLLSAIPNGPNVAQTPEIAQVVLAKAHVAATELLATAASGDDAAALAAVGCAAPSF